MQGRFAMLGLGAALFAALWLAACGGGGGDVSTRDSSLARGALAYGGDLPPASCEDGEQLDGGRSYRVEFASRVDGEPVVIQVFEPQAIDCDGRHPLILEGHGYSGSRQTDDGGFVIGPDIGALTAAGYAVISIDQRGHGESGGTVRVMDPAFEGQDLIAIVDWAEQHLDYLARRNGNLLLGAVGGSYGGGFQFLLWATDPDSRMDAMVPEITWHDLDYSLNPGQVPKSYWGLVLAGLGDANTQLGQDPFIRATLLESGATGTFPEASRAFFNSHSPSYFCDNPLGLVTGDTGDSSQFTLDPVTGLLPLTADGEFVVEAPSFAGGAPPPVDALIFQGPRDDLFNMNEAFANYQCLKRGGGDVRLLSYPFGHQFLSPNAGLLIEAALTQSVPLDRACGPIDASQAALAFFDDKLRGIGDVDEVVTTGRDICFSLTQGDAVALPEMPIGGEAFAIEGAGGLPVTVPINVAGALPTIVPLTTVGEDINAIAGIPTADITLSRGGEALDEACLEQSDPLLGLGSCDAIVFVGVGVIRAGLPAPDLINEQVLPLRGIGRHDVELVGIGERLAEGDQLVLMLFGFQDGFALTGSRDLLTPVVTVSGEVALPLLDAPPID